MWATIHTAAALRIQWSRRRTIGLLRTSKKDNGTLYNVKPPQKTNAARLLDQMGIHYELREYEVDPDDLAAETVAAKIGLPPEQVFKTLVARGDRNGISMAVIPGDQELNLKALAAAAGERKIQLVPVKELQALTGYIRGGVTALAAKRDFPVYVDETIELFDVVSISAGMRGLQILIAPADYLRATKGTIAALGQPKKRDT
ncbi:MAG: Cys-tRNA(Pro) deacylase [Acidobacteriia bacterium]|nr:Cys-tRNA(Pro) deacylase [Terriglobia bacterium]